MVKWKKGKILNEINNTNDINEYLDNVIATLCKEKTIANINFSLNSG